MLPITLAAFDGGAIFFFIMIAVAGFINWLGEQKKQKAAAEDAARRPGETPGRPNRPIPTGEPEEERLRRFLEALGVPGEGPESAPPRPQPVAPLPVPRATLRPAPKPAPRQPAPVAKPRIFHVEPEPAESRDPGRLEESATAIESIADHFAAMEKGVQLSALDGIPEARTARAARMAPVQAAFDSEQAPVRQGAGQAAAVLAMLRSPEDLRKAFVIREILGPPPGLQS